MNAALLSRRLSPRPESNLDASNQPANASLVLPLARSLRQQTPEDLIELLDALHWVVLRYDLHINQATPNMRTIVSYLVNWIVSKTGFKWFVEPSFRRVI